MFLLLWPVASFSPSEPRGSPRPHAWQTANPLDALRVVLNERANVQRQRKSLLGLESPKYAEEWPLRIKVIPKPKTNSCLPPRVYKFNTQSSYKENNASQAGLGEHFFSTRRHVTRRQHSAFRAARRSTGPASQLWSRSTARKFSLSTSAASFSASSFFNTKAKSR